jgi:hypothetical protein
MIKKISLIIFFCFLASGCATSNYSKTATPVTVSEEFTREGPLTWAGTRIVAIGNIEFPPAALDSTYTVDPGEKTIRVAYKANRGEMKIPAMFYETDPLAISVMLKPNGKYQVRSIATEDSAKFRIIDLLTNEVIATSGETPIIYRSSQQQRSTTVVPIIIRR